MHSPLAKPYILHQGVLLEKQHIRNLSGTKSLKSDQAEKHSFH